MKLNQAISKRIKELLKDRNLTQYGLFKLTGVPQSTISTILKGDLQTVKLSTIYEICSGLNLEIDEFFNKDYFKLNNLED